MALVGTTSTGNNANWSHTVSAGTDLALVVCVGTHQGTLSAVTWNGVSLTSLVAGRSTLNESGEIWILMNPTPATGTVAVTMSGGSWWGGTAINLSLVKQVPTTSIVTASNFGSSSLATVAITPTTPNSILIASAGAEASMTATGQQIQVSALANQSFEDACASYQLISSTKANSMSCTLSSGQRWGIAAISLEASPSVNMNFYLKQGFE